MIWNIFDILLPRSLISKWIYLMGAANLIDMKKTHIRFFTCRCWIVYTHVVAQVWFHTETHHVLTRFTFGLIHAANSEDHGIKVCQINSLHFINIFDTATKVLPLCSVHQTPFRSLLSHCWNGVCNTLLIRARDLFLRWFALLAVQTISRINSMPHKPTQWKMVLSMWD